MIFVTKSNCEFGLCWGIIIIATIKAIIATTRITTIIIITTTIIAQYITFIEILPYTKHISKWFIIFIFFL